MRSNKCIITHFCQIWILGFINPGPGLGILLFPIGRALQTNIKNEVFVRPTMFNLKLGHLLNREKNSKVI